MFQLRLLIAGILLILLNHKIGYSQADTITMNEVVVTAGKSPILYNETSRMLEIVNSNKIEALPITNINDLLDGFSGIDMRSRGFEGMQGDLTIRGGNFDQILILLDGVNITDVQSGHHNLNLPVNIEDVERIEILKGAGARIWGPNAYSGAINIITKKPAGNNLNASFKHGSHNYLQPQIAVSNTLGKYSHYTSFVRSSSDGYTENTDFLINTFFHKSNLNLKPLNLNIAAGHTDKQFGAQSFYTPLYPNQFEHIRSSFASISSSYKNKNFAIEANAYFKRHQDRFELFRNNPPEWYTSHNYHLTGIQGFKLNGSFYSKLGKTNGGFEFRNETIFSNVLGNPLEKSTHVPFEKEGQFTRTANREMYNIFFEQILYLKERTILSGGVLCNYNGFLLWNFFPGIDISYMLVRNRLNLIGSCNKSLRMPTFTDLYYKSRTQTGNANLKPEKTNSLESGLKLYNHYLSVTTTAFVNYGSNIIDWVKLPDTALWQSMNITELNTSGFELLLNLKADHRWQIPIRQFYMGYTYIDIQKSTASKSSLYALDFLKHKISASLDIKIAKYLYTNISSIWQDRNGSYDRFDYNSHTFEGQEDYQPFSKTDLKVYWQKDNFQAFTECLNVFNEHYYDFGNIPMPGRLYRWGLKVNFKFKGS